MLLQARHNEVDLIFAQDDITTAALIGKVLHVDDSKFSIVIRNLVSNALKFTPKGGKVTVSMKVLPVQLAESSLSNDSVRVVPAEQVCCGKLSMVIADTGYGISQVC